MEKTLFTMDKVVSPSRTNEKEVLKSFISLIFYMLLFALLILLLSILFFLVFCEPETC